MSDFLWQLEQALLANNIQIIGNIKPNDTKPQRFKQRSKPNGGHDIFVILHGDKGATFGDWHYPDQWVAWWLNGRNKLTLKDRTDYEIQKQLMEQERMERRQWAIKRAENFWLNHPSTKAVYDHPYIQKKRINPYFSKVIVKDRWIKNILFIPIRNVDYEFQGVQIIKPYGQNFKRPWKGTTYKDNMVWLSIPPPENYRGVIRVCEGYATGCTIYEATGHITVCALSAYNMVNTVVQLKRKYVHANIKVCADNDAHGKENIGVILGKEAAQFSGGHFYYPEFKSYHGKKLTDFNDLFQQSGIDEVKRQLISYR